MLALLACGLSHGARREALDLTHHRLELPGPPAALIPADVNGDGLTDLAVVLAYTELESIGVDRIEDMVQISTVIPALFDRRELRLFVGREDGSLEPHGVPLELPDSVLSVTAVDDGKTLLALTDEGVARIRFDPPDGVERGLETIIADPPVIAGTHNFYSTLDWVFDLNGDGRPDLVPPSRDGPTVYLGHAGGFSAEPAQRIALAGSNLRHGSSVRRRYPIPSFERIDADEHVDLVARGSSRALHVMLGNGDGTFRAIQPPSPECAEGTSTLALGRRDAVSGFKGDVVFFGDIDGDGRTELVTREEQASEKSGMRAEMKQAKRPRQVFRFHRLGADLQPLPEPYLEYEASGHSLEEVDFGGSVMQLFQDLDGDGRRDLVMVTLRFSMLQAVKVLTTKRISIGLDFHVHAQQPDGTFREVEGLDLSEKLKFDLNDLEIGRLAQFAGDFDGDGRIDFVHLGRGNEVTIHRGQPGCRYSPKPDLSILLDEEPQAVGLVRIEDLDLDGRADLAVTGMRAAEQADVSPRVVLDLYLSGGER